MSLNCQILLEICIFKHNGLMMQLAVQNLLEVLHLKFNLVLVIELI